MFHIETHRDFHENKRLTGCYFINYYFVVIDFERSKEFINFTAIIFFTSVPRISCRILHTNTFFLQ